LTINYASWVTRFFSLNVKTYSCRGPIYCCFDVDGKPCGHPRILMLLEKRCAHSLSEYRISTFVNGHFGYEMTEFFALIVAIIMPYVPSEEHFLILL